MSYILVLKATALVKSQTSLFNGTASLFLQKQAELALLAFKTDF